MSLDSHHYERLVGIRRRYQNKRTLGYQLVDECLALVESAVAEEEARAAGRIETVEGYHETTKRTVEHLRTRVTHLEAQLAEKRALSEAREQAGEEVKVTIARSLKGWVVADLEEIAYRLRCGGAVDDTGVKITDYTATALVPAPDLVRLERVSREPARDDFAYDASDVRPREEPDRPSRGWLATAWAWSAPLTVAAGIGAWELLQAVVR